MITDSTLDAMTETVIASVARDLEAIGSSLVTGGALEDTLEATIRDILDKTVLRTFGEGEPPAAISVRYAVTAEFKNIAVTEAEAHRHPAEPLMAAEVIFDVALPYLTRRIPEANPIRLARILHNEIWRRFPPGAIAYVEFILNKLAHAERQERLVISRELHDRVAHRMALALQRIELAKASPSDVEAHLKLAESEIRDSLLDVQDIAVALRPMVGNRSIESAVDDLAARLPASPNVLVRRTGDAQELLDSVAEELFIIVVEAVRNARRHAQGTQIVVSFEWASARLSISVEDDGDGFDVATSSPSGLHTMAERAQVIGARLTVSSNSGGTAVVVDMPLGRATRVGE